MSEQDIANEPVVKWLELRLGLTEEELRLIHWGESPPLSNEQREATPDEVGSYVLRLVNENLAILHKYHRMWQEMFVNKGEEPCEPTSEPDPPPS